MAYIIPAPLRESIIYRRYGAALHYITLAEPGIWGKRFPYYLITEWGSLQQAESILGVVLTINPRENYSAPNAYFVFNRSKTATMIVNDLPDIKLSPSFQDFTEDMEIIQSTHSLGKGITIGHKGSVRIYGIPNHGFREFIQFPAEIGRP